jgi:8-oxo-dGTP pyrophosphatase MutT (NUDIX family)
MRDIRRGACLWRPVWTGVLPQAMMGGALLIDDSGPIAGHALGAAVVVISQAGHVLFVHHNYGRRNWEIPGGRCEVGESALDGAVREVREELGVDARIRRCVGVYWEPSEAGRGMHHFVFRAELLGALPTHPPDPREIIEWGWFDLERPPRPISDFTLRRVRDAIQKSQFTFATITERTWLE